MQTHRYNTKKNPLARAPSSNDTLVSRLSTVAKLLSFVSQSAHNIQATPLYIGIADLTLLYSLSYSVSFYAHGVCKMNSVILRSSAILIVVASDGAHDAVSEEGARRAYAFTLFAARQK